MSSTEPDAFASVPTLFSLGEFVPLGPSLHHSREQQHGSGREPSIENAVEVTAGEGCFFLFNAREVEGSSREVPMVQGLMQEEEIFYTGCNVIWSGGGCIRKRFTMPATVEKVVWCHFASSPTPLLCVQSSDSITTFSMSGESLVIPLPWPLRALFCLPHALLVQRHLPSPPPASKLQPPFPLHDPSLHSPHLHFSSPSSAFHLSSPHLHSPSLLSEVLRGGRKPPHTSHDSSNRDRLSSPASLSLSPSSSSAPYHQLLPNRQSNPFSLPAHPSHASPAGRGRIDDGRRGREAWERGEERDEAQPSFFLLMHPIDEFKPIHLEPLSSKTRSFAEEQLIWTVPLPCSPPLFATFNSLSCQHSVWAVRLSSPHAAAGPTGGGQEEGREAEGGGNASAVCVWSSGADMASDEAAEVLLVGRGMGQQQVASASLWSLLAASSSSQSGGDGTTQLCLFFRKRQQLVALHLPTRLPPIANRIAVAAESSAHPPSHSLGWHREAADVASLCESKFGPFFLLLLTPDQNLLLLSAGNSVLWNYPLHLALPPHLLPTPPLSASPCPLLSFHHSLADRVTIRRGQGKPKRYRVKLNLSSPLVRSCLSALSLFPNPNLPARLHSLLLCPPPHISSHIASNSDLSPAGSRCQDAEGEWNVLSSIVAGWVEEMEGMRSRSAEQWSEDSVGHVTVRERSVRGRGHLAGAAVSWGETGELGEGTDNWRQLLQDDYHQQTAASTSYSSLPSLSTLPPLSRSSQPSHSAAFTALLPAGVEKVSEEALRGMLLLLHAVYENLKLDSREWRSIPLLAALLHKMAVSLGEPHFAAEYESTVLCFYEATSSLHRHPTLPSRSSSPVHPPSLFAWLHSSLAARWPASPSLLPAVVREEVLRWRGRRKGKEGEAQGHVIPACVKRSVVVVLLLQQLLGVSHKEGHEGEGDERGAAGSGSDGGNPVEQDAEMMDATCDGGGDGDGGGGGGGDVDDEEDEDDHFEDASYVEDDIEELPEGLNASHPPAAVVTFSNGAAASSAQSDEQARGMSSSNLERQRGCVQLMVELGVSMEDLQGIPAGILLPLLQALLVCRQDPPTSWQSHAFALISRADLLANDLGSLQRTLGSDKKAVAEASLVGDVRHNNKRHEMQQEERKEETQWDSFGGVNSSLLLPGPPFSAPLQEVPTEGEGESIDFLSGSDDMSMQRAADVGLMAGMDGVDDGMEHMLPLPNSTLALRFNSDLRISEVRRLLCSSRPVPLPLTGGADVSDPDVVAQQQAQLWRLAMRTLSLPFGRAAFTFASASHFITEPLRVPKLVLSGRVPSQNNATVGMDGSQGNVAELMQWATFHNAVAAGLRILPSQGAMVTRTWIAYNKPHDAHSSHAGLLFALGLMRHLAVLEVTDVYRYLSQEHDVTTVGVLLGLSCAYRGSMDPAVSKILYVHIPARHPPTFPDLDLTPAVQSAALVGVGLLYQATAHRLTTEILIAELGMRPGGEWTHEREGYALAAGFALGLVTLGTAGSAFGLADLRIEDRLQQFLSNSSGPRMMDASRSCKASPSVGGIFLRDTWGTDGSSNNGQVMEAGLLNLDVTSPAATVALALMYLKSNNATVASRVAVPSTHFDLELIRPDFILLRVVARSLILWDSISATEEWLQGQIPDVVSAAINSPHGSVSANSAATAAPDGSLSADIDMEALHHAHFNLIAGACLAIGLRFAGSWNESAQNLLHKYCLFFLRQKRLAAAAVSSQVDGTTSSKLLVDPSTLETCLNTAVLSLAVVMAGSGNLDILRLLRFLRRRVGKEANVAYGSHVAVSMSLGFLFLSGGMKSFGTSNSAIAALLMALYPSCAASPNDHRCHLQVLRHMWVLAVEDRSITAVDVDTWRPVMTPLSIHLSDNTNVSFTTPCVLPHLSTLRQVAVVSPQFWPRRVAVDAKHLSLLSDSTPAPRAHGWSTRRSRRASLTSTASELLLGPLELAVKKRGTSFLLPDDATGLLSFLSRSLHYLHIGREAGPAPELGGSSSSMAAVSNRESISLFSSDPFLLSFHQLLCDGTKSQPLISTALSSCLDSYPLFASSSLHAAIATEQPLLPQMLLSLLETIHSLRATASLITTGSSGLSSPLPLSMRLLDLKLMQAYMRGVPPQDDASALLLIISKDFVEVICMAVEDTFHSVLNSHIENPNETTLSHCMALLLSDDDSAAHKKGHAVRWKTFFNLYLLWSNMQQPSNVHRVMKHSPTLHHHVLPVLNATFPELDHSTLMVMAKELNKFKARE